MDKILDKWTSELEYQMSFMGHSEEFDAIYFSESVARMFDELRKANKPEPANPGSSEDPLKQQAQED